MTEPKPTKKRSVSVYVTGDQERLIKAVRDMAPEQVAYLQAWVDRGGIVKTKPS
jgi:hypothetical protein